ncbi:unnamed protein product, partial [Amoebophrya sp. A120]|eukprot:GSA120T00017850001.1
MVVCFSFLVQLDLSMINHIRVPPRILESSTYFMSSSVTMQPTILVTGASGRIGKEILVQLLEHYTKVSSAATIVGVVRNEQRAQEVKSYLQQRVPAMFSSGGENKSTKSGKQVQFEIDFCDVSLQSDVLTLAKKWQDRPLHVLINNAAVTPEEQKFTKENIDLQFATNVLGYHWMIKAFEPNLLLGSSTASGSSSGEAVESRIVNVASFYAGELDVSDPEFRKREYDVDSSYRASKQANRMQSRGFADLFANEGKKIICNAVHPGIATSKVSLGLGFDLDRSQAAAEDCARGPVRLAVDSGEKRSGKYFEGDSKKPSRCKWQEDSQKVGELLDLCESYCSGFSTTVSSRRPGGALANVAATSARGSSVSTPTRGEVVGKVNKAANVCGKDEAAGRRARSRSR